MAHLSQAGPDGGHFSTLEVRSKDDLVELTSRDIAFPKRNYTSAPNIAGGFKMLDLAHAPTSGAHAVRANLVGWDVTKEGFKVGLETWNGGEMYAAEAMWIEKARDARECHFGQFDTMDVEGIDSRSRVKQSARPLLGRSFSSSRFLDLPSVLVLKKKDQEIRQEYSKNVKFPVVFKEKPSVVCWLNRLDLPSGSRFRIRASCDVVSETKAKVRLNTWGSDAADLDGAAMCWVVFPHDKKYTDTGTFGVGRWDDAETMDEDDDLQDDQLEKWTNDDGEEVRGARGRVKFKKGWFPRIPTVLVALNMIDTNGNTDLKIRAVVEDVSEDGFSWAIETWGNCKLYSASASWVALGFT